MITRKHFALRAMNVVDKMNTVLGALYLILFVVEILDRLFRKYQEKVLDKFDD